MGRGNREDSSASSGSGSSPKVRKRRGGDRDGKASSDRTPRNRSGTDRSQQKHYSDDDDYSAEEEYKVDLGRSNASTRAKNQTSNPSSMLKLCETVIGLVEKKRLPEIEYSKFTPTAIQSLTLDNEDCFDRETRQAIPSLSHFYAIASATRNVPFLDAVTRVKSYIQDEPSAILLHPKFPQKPQSAAITYHRKLQAKGSNMMLRDARAKFDNDPTDPDVTAAINEFNAEHENYGDKIREFMEEEKGSILPHQVTYLNKMIRTHEKKTSKAKKSVPDARGRPKKPADGFSLYVDNMKDKYDSLTEAERSRKLREEYDNLSASQRTLLETMAKK